MSIGDTAVGAEANVKLSCVHALAPEEVEKTNKASETDKKYLAVRIEFENTSNGPVSLSAPLDFTLKDEHDKKFTYTPNPSKDMMVPERPVGEDDTLIGKILYEVPNSARGLHLEYSPFGEGRAYTWLIGDINVYQSGERCDV
jgi:hypothetical protein